MKSILIVDDEKGIRDLLTIMLEGEGYRVVTAGSGDTAMKLLKRKDFDLVITDIRMRGTNGIDVLKTAREAHPNTPVVMMTAYASAETAVEAMKKGAFDYISKPFEIENLQLIVKNAIEKKKLVDENRHLKSALKDKFEFANFIGKSPVMQKVFSLIEKLADSNATVLITGESGTGKELVAKAIHFNGARRNHPFISINCGAMPENLLESELFGHEKGIFTGAESGKVGLMEVADKGTFFLDEVAESPPAIQVKLLRVLQEKEIQRVGGSLPIRVDLRIIAASNQDLHQAVKKESFREDLFYRLNVVPIRLPSLRERRDDIPLLIEHFLNKYNQEHPNKLVVKGVHPEAMSILEKYHWPGNVRELANAIERAVVLEMSDIVNVSSLPEQIVQGPELPVAPLPTSLGQDPIDLEKTLDQVERRLIQDALKDTNGIIHKAAENLSLSFRSMRYRIQKHNLKGKSSPKP